MVFLFSVFVAEEKNLMRAAISFMLMSITLGIFYLLMGYNLLGIIQILVYSIALAAILLFIISVTKGGESVE